MKDALQPTRMVIVFLEMESVYSIPEGVTCCGRCLRVQNLVWWCFRTVYVRGRHI